jgi:BirA family biotin operon repressor/biotin-[acetyl-CoA-carboxylase] ligase
MPFGSGVMLSVGWSFKGPPAGLAAMTLACGVAARDALLALGVSGVSLKWPNDLVWGGGKLGGILVEMSSVADKSCHVVVGIGVNFELDQGARLAIESRWGRGPVDVREAFRGGPLSRNQLAAALVNETHQVFASYPDSGFAPYRARFREADALAGQAVSVVTPEGTIAGQAAGVDDDGALIVLTPAGPRRVTSGEVCMQDPT